MRLIGEIIRDVILLAASLAATVIICRAEEPIALVYTGWYSEADAIKVFDTLNAFYLKSIKIHLAPAEFISVEGASTLNTSEAERTLAANERFFQWLDFLSSWNLINKNVPILIISGPIVTEAHAYQAGLGTVASVGINFPIVLSFCGPDKGICLVISAHEMSHVNGAKHLRTVPRKANIMDPAALDFGMQALVMLHRTKVQIRKHLKRVRLWKAFRS